MTVNAETIIADWAKQKPWELFAYLEQKRRESGDARTVVALRTFLHFKRRVEWETGGIPVEIRPRGVLDMIGLAKVSSS